MSTETGIQGLAQPERLNASTLRLLAPGYSGRTVELAQAGEARAAGDRLPLAEAAAEADAAVITRLLIELKPPVVPTVAAGGRGGITIPPQLLVPVQAGANYAALHTDETGRMTWLFPAATSDSQQVVFALPPERETADGDGGRGPVVALMRRVVRVVAWLAEPVVGAGARVAAAMWEGKRRPHALWQLTADRSFVPPQWEIFTQGPGLLLIHGTFSTPQAGFCGWLDTPAFEPIMARYGGRVLTLAHPSVSVSPTDNIDWLQTHIPPGQSFGGMMDIVCHSRGGLLARDLAARAGAPKINRVCQVGAPNLGTPLADARHWVTFLDSHTNCLTLLPDTASTILLEGLLCLVKILGTGVARGLPGLAAMDPEGEWLKAASEKAAGDARWFTIGANYEPAGAVAAGFASRLRDRAADAVTDAFFATDNDLVVPSDGCHNPGPPIVDSLRLSGAETNHCTYFASRHVHDALSTWLALA